MCKEMSFEERSAINAYTLDAYANINASLRGLDSFSPVNKERAVHIHNALQQASIPCECVVYRGMSQKALGRFEKFSDHELIGCHIREAGFMSTSLNKEDAFKGNILLEISVPQGEKGAYVGYISGMGHSENEVLFDTGRRYRITSVKYDLDGRRIVCATMY